MKLTKREKEKIKKIYERSESYSKPRSIDNITFHSCPDDIGLIINTPCNFKCDECWANAMRDFAKKESIFIEKIETKGYSKKIKEKIIELYSSLILWR